MLMNAAVRSASAVRRACRQTCMKDAAAARRGLVLVVRSVSRIDSILIQLMTAVTADSVADSSLAVK